MNLGCLPIDTSFKRPLMKATAMKKNNTQM